MPFAICVHSFTFPSRRSDMMCVLFARVRPAGRPPSQSLSPSRRSALTAELSSKESSLSLLVQTYAALLENVSPAERANHKAIFDEFEQTKDELEKEIAAIKKQIA